MENKKPTYSELEEKVNELEGTVHKLEKNCKEIMRLKESKKELKDSEHQLRILFDYAPNAVYIHDLKGNFVDGNKAAEKLIGYKKDELIGKNFLKLNILQKNEIIKAAMLLTKNLLKKPTGPDEFTIHTKYGSNIPVEIMTQPIKIENKNLVLGIVRDITEQKKLKDKLKEQLIRDPLTGLYNRYYYNQNIDGIIKNAKKEKQDIGFSMCDLNNFKYLNDNFGHLSGDVILKKFAHLLSLSIREEDYAIRFGGDEFLVISTNANDSTGQKIEQRLNKNINNHYKKNDQKKDDKIYDKHNNRKGDHKIPDNHNNQKIDYKISVSVGHVLRSYLSKEPIEDTITTADKNMYKAKKNYNGNIS